MLGALILPVMQPMMAFIMDRQATRHAFLQEKLIGLFESTLKFTIFARFFLLLDLSKIEFHRVSARAISQHCHDCSLEVYSYELIGICLFKKPSSARRSYWD